MLQGLSERDLAAMPPFPFPRELFPTGTFPPGVRFSRDGLQGVPPSVEALLGAGDGAALGVMHATALAEAPAQRASVRHLRAEDFQQSCSREGLQAQSEAEQWAHAQDLLHRMPGFETLSSEEQAQLLRFACAEFDAADAGWDTDDSCATSSTASQQVSEGVPVADLPHPPSQPGVRLESASSQQHQQQQRQESQQPSASAGMTGDDAGPLRQAWFAAAKCGDVEELCALHAQHAALLHVQGPGVGHTALHWAAAKGHVSAVCWLLAQPGTDVNARNACQSTAVHAAATHGHEDVVRVLLRRTGCDAAAVNEDDDTPAQPCDAARPRSSCSRASACVHWCRAEQLPRARSFD